MVTRSSSGTGVVVSLVVFVLCTVFLLVLSIVFYSGQVKAMQAQDEAESTLNVYATAQQRNREHLKALEAQAARGESVVRQLEKRYQDLMQYVAGEPTATLESVRSQFASLGVDSDATVRAALRDYESDLRSGDQEIESLKSRLSSHKSEIEELDQRMTQLQENHQQQLETVNAKISAYERAAENYRGEVQDVKGEYNSAIDRLKDSYQDQILRLENEKDRLFQERSVLKSRLDELQEILSVSRLKAQDPSTLVDGEIVDSLGNDEVYINRGKEDRIVLGVTFEVYDNEAALQDVDRVTGQLPRGKASLQVVQVRTTTAKCKITRAIPGRPVVRGDVIANAVYDPSYVFKFLVHGKFDVDGDGRPSETEAEYLRSLIVNWGGDVVSGEQLPGDLDFLVLGVEPPRPLPLRTEATEFQIDEWVRKRRAHEKYHELFRQASEAQIPVLNANRFFILIGYTDR